MGATHQDSRNTLVTTTNSGTADNNTINTSTSRPRHHQHKRTGSKLPGTKRKRSALGGRRRHNKSGSRVDLDELQTSTNINNNNDHSDSDSSSSSRSTATPQEGFASVDNQFIL